MTDSAEFLRGVLADHDASIAEKINAAKALEQIERRAGAGSQAGLFDMTLEELNDEIAQVRALILKQGVEITG